ncbi:hypothetical protein K9L67_04160 [Candidatus Woesearchaeota archaeon]|nr:hypothetical protein [Candidatus Woesearchaeota archaeon]MCF7901395.1 hypothetical protein [Candidatus Woesearchaeota archaeon]MCF8013731.1 hypothetical protein [Candidatus Woesearchaeota archaeon]
MKHILVVKPEAIKHLKNIEQELNKREYVVENKTDKIPYFNLLMALYGQNNSSMNPKKILSNPDPSFFVEGYPLTPEYFMNSYINLEKRKIISWDEFFGIGYLVSDEQNTNEHIINDIKGNHKNSFRYLFGLKPELKTDIFGNPVNKIYDIRHNGIHLTQIHETEKSLNSQFEYEYKTLFGDISER